jgi:K+-transporting ATPase KdpF subunit
LKIATPWIVGAAEAPATERAWHLRGLSRVTLEYFAGAILSLLLTSYLVYALLRPEKF